MERNPSTPRADINSYPEASASSWRAAGAIEGNAHELFTRHANECATLAYGCSIVLGLSLSQCGAIAQAAWLHDVGELMLPREAAGHPSARGVGHRTVSDAHCRLGASLISEERSALGANADLLSEVAIYHHERWDGTGYPFALSEERIPLAARLVAVVDHYQDLIRWSDEASLFSEARAIHEIRAGRGTLFDPRCADALVSCLGHDLLGKIRQFSNLFNTGLGSFAPLENLVGRALIRHRKAAQRARVGQS